MPSLQCSFRGYQYVIDFLQDYPGDPSWYTYQDETDVRNDTWLIAPGDVVFDVGAAYGSYTMAALAAGAKHVYSWVPQFARESDLLKRSVSLNGWVGRSTVITECGLYDRAGYIDVDSQTILDKPNDETGCIKVDTLDSWYLRNEDSIPRGRRWLKIDTEGAEPQVIEGGKSFIENESPIIQVENHIFKRSTIADEVKSQLEEIGYVRTWHRPYHAISHSVFYPKSML